MNRGCWLIAGMSVLIAVLGCAGQPSGDVAEQRTADLTLRTDGCVYDFSDTTNTTAQLAEFMHDADRCVSRTDLVRTFREYFAGCLHLIDSTAVVPPYRNDTEIFVAPCLGPEVATVYQGDRSDSAFTAYMIGRYVHTQADTPRWWFDSCRTDWSPEHCRLDCSAGQVSFNRMDLNQRLFFRFWQRVGDYPMMYEVDGISEHDSDCGKEYLLATWRLSAVRIKMIFQDEEPEDATEPPVRSIQI